MKLTPGQVEVAARKYAELRAVRSGMVYLPDAFELELCVRAVVDTLEDDYDNDMITAIFHAIGPGEGNHG